MIKSVCVCLEVNKGRERERIRRGDEKERKKENIDILSLIILRKKDRWGERVIREERKEKRGRKIKKD